MSYIIVAVIVSMACFVLGWYAGIEDAKYHIIRKLVRAKDNLTEAESAELVKLLLIVSKNIHSE